MFLLSKRIVRLSGGKKDSFMVRTSADGIPDAHERGAGTETEGHVAMVAEPRSENVTQSLHPCFGEGFDQVNELIATACDGDVSVPSRDGAAGAVCRLSELMQERSAHWHLANFTPTSSKSGSCFT